MTYLLASIVCSVLAFVLLKMVHKQKINVEQAVTVSYIATVILTMLVSRLNLNNPQVFLPTWWPSATLNILLPSMFIIMGKSVDAASTVKSDAAQRLSLFLPTIASFTLFHKQLTEGRLIGLALAFTVLFFLLWKNDGGKKSDGLSTRVMLLLGVWCDYGVIDILFKRTVKSGTVLAGSLLVTFCSAAILMLGYLFTKENKQTKEGIVGGMILGCLNFLNIVTYISAHQIIKDNLTLMFADMDIGVIVLGTLIGAVMFKEKISSINTTDVSIAIRSVACLLY